MLPITIYLTPPYIAVSQTSVGYSIELGNNTNLTFGIIEQINYSTSRYAVGETILYPANAGDKIIFINEVQYSLINEDEIILVEPTPP
jgi:co-chaperonin GroES (HSP10)